MDNNCWGLSNWCVTRRRISLTLVRGYSATSCEGAIAAWAWAKVAVDATAGALYRSVFVDLGRSSKLGRDKPTVRIDCCDAVLVARWIAAGGAGTSAEKS